MSSERTEALTYGTVNISTVSGNGSGVVQGTQNEDDTWTIEVFDRSTRTQHRAGDGELLQLIEGIAGGVTPVLQVAAGGQTLSSVQTEDAIAPHQAELSRLMTEQGTVGSRLWQEALPYLLGPEAMDAQWKALWSDGWGWAYDRTWTADEPFVWTSPVTGDQLTLTYREVVTCKFNEAEPLCIRIEMEVTPSAASSAAAARAMNARIRSGMDPVAMTAAELQGHERTRTGELIIEAPTGLPWRWSTHTEDAFAFEHEGSPMRMTLTEDSAVSCDWRVAE